MPSPMLSPHETDIAHKESMDPPKRLLTGDELRQNLAQLKIGGKEECLRMKRLLGAANQDFVTYSLPVSRVRPPFLHRC